jgi:hypothetical protein
MPNTPSPTRLLGVLLQLTVSREHGIAPDITDDEGVVGVLRGEPHAHAAVCKK